LLFLKNAGIVVPEEIPSDEDSIRLDFTRLSNRDIGAIHSRYSVRHSHAIFHAAMGASNLVVCRRNLRIAEAKFRIIHQGEKKTDVDAMMEADKRISKRRNELAQIEANLEIINAVALGYEDIRNAASREMTRRIGERAATD
jgi:hypothetical protein